MAVLYGLMRGGSQACALAFVEASVKNCHSLSDTFQHLQRLFQLIICMGSRHDGPDAGFAFGNRRVGDAGAEHALLEELAGEVHGEFAVADDDGRDWGFARGRVGATDVEAEQAEFFLPEAGILPKFFDPLGFVFQNLESRDAGCRDGWRMRSGEQERARTVVEEVDEVARATDVAAERTDCLGESSDLYIDAAVDVEVIDCAAAVAAEHAGCVGVVDHHDGAVFFGEIAERREGADVAVHGEDAVSDEELFAGLVLHTGELGFGVGNVLVLEDKNPGTGEASTVDDGGVVQLVGDDEIVFAENGGHSASVGGESGLENNAGFNILETRDLFFQFHMDFHRAGNRAHRPGTDPVFARGFESCFAKLGMSGEAKVIVGGKINDALAVESADGGLLVFENAQAEVRALRLQIIKLVGKKRERIGTRCSRHSRK